MKKRKRFFVELVVLLFLSSILCGLALGGFVFVSYLNGLPSIDLLEGYAGERWGIPSQLYSIDDELVGEFFIEKRDIIPLSLVPKRLIDAIIAIEDQTFFRHRGINLRGILRAFFVNLRAGKIHEGGSSITQQLVKLLFLSNEKSYRRKLQEALLAIEVERRFSKEEILERYLNKIYLGHGAYGVEAASKRYFGKHVKDLTLAECAMIAGLIKAPNRYSPITRPEEAKIRQRVVLNRMVRLNYITKDEAKKAREDLERMLREGMIGGVLSINKAPYFVEYIRQDLEERYGSNALYKGGLKIYTTIDLRMQKAAQDILTSALKRLNKGHQKRPRIEGAIVAIDPKTGYIKAMVGGSGFTPDNQLNRATQARRQAGSAFKPFLYTAAIDNGWTAADTLMDEPVVYQGWPSEWTPENYDGRFRGLVTLRKALEDSINVASVRLMEKVTPDVVIDYARRMGIKSRLTSNLTLALGTSEVVPLEMAFAFGVFANQGVKVRPISIRYIKDLDGVLLEENIPYEEEVLSKETAYIMTSLMEGVVKRGTASLAIGESLGRPVAGKTGTSSDFADAWFVGFTPDLVACVWIGCDKGRSSLGKGMTGAIVAAPIWREFMKIALQGIPPSDFEIPEGISIVKICSKTGLLPSPDCVTINEAFICGTEPTNSCNGHLAPLSDTKEDEEEGSALF